MWCSVVKLRLNYFFERAMSTRNLPMDLMVVFFEDNLLTPSEMRKIHIWSSESSMALMESRKLPQVKCMAKWETLKILPKQSKTYQNHTKIASKLVSFCASQVVAASFSPASPLLHFQLEAASALAKYEKNRK